MNFIIGLFLLLLGGLTIAFGGRTVKNAGRIAELFSLGPMRATLVKWSIGCLLIWLGLFFLLGLK